MSTFYDAPNDYRSYLCHYGVPNMKRPHGLKYKKRGTSLREHRLNQVKTATRQELEQRRSDQEHERLAREHEARINNRTAERHHDFEATNRRREADRIAAESHDEKKRRQQEQLEFEMQREAERRANTKGGNQSLSGNRKRLQNLINQTGVVTPGRHQAMYYQQQINSRRRRRHSH